MIDPRQQLTVKAYTDPLSPTFSNLRRSMRNAGYSDKYSDVILGQPSKPEWLTETMQDTVDMVQAAEKNLKRYATMNINVDDKNAIDWARLQVDVSKYITKSLASKKYSDNKDAEIPNVQINIVNYGSPEVKKGDVIDVDIK